MFCFKNQYASSWLDGKVTSPVVYKRSLLLNMITLQCCSKLTATYVFNPPTFAISLSVSACCLETLSASYWRVCSCFFTNSLSDNFGAS